MPRPSKPTNGSPESSPKPSAAKKKNGHLSDEDVSKKAFELYQSRGGHHGNDLQDWFEAERQLRSTVPPKTARKPKAQVKTTT